MPQRDCPTFTVKLNGEPVDWLRPIHVQLSIGGARLDNALVEIDRRQVPNSSDYAKLANREFDRLDVGNQSTLRIEGEDSDGNTFKYFSGYITQHRVTLQDRVEVEELVARVELWLFGDPILGRRQWDPKAGEVVNSDLEVHFNPEIDGRVWGNKRTGSDPLGGSNALAFIDAESLRSDAARKYQGEPTWDGSGDNPNLWKLSDVVFYLIETCRTTDPHKSPFGDNQGATILEGGHPKLSDLQELLDDDTDQIRDLKIPDGTFLPQALDLVLMPLGYAWYLDYSTGDFTRLTIYKRGEGTDENVVELQAPGDSLDTDATNLAAANLDYDVSTTYNQIQGLGDFLHVEATFTLSPAWDPKYDDIGSLPAGGFSLKKSGPDFDDKYHDVYRKFVLNEAGDYIGLRPELKDPFDFSSVISLGDFADGFPTNAIARRRRFLPTLTLDPNTNRPIGKLHGCTLEYMDKAQSKWLPVAAGVSLLHTECGVWFDGELPPLRGFEAGGFITIGDPVANIQLRITATVEFDARLSYLADSTDGSSPLSKLNNNTLVLDMPHFFKWRLVDSSSIYFDSDFDAIEDNDLEKLLNYCEQIRERWNTAALHGTCVIEGVDDFRTDPPYQIGQSITKISGRDISFDVTGEHAQEAKYPQIVGITYDFRHQKTILQLERFREPPRLLRKAEGVQVSRGEGRGTRG